jgi:DNA-binding SARP family transcriptional activator/tetratricopeptide (TPR) repeat protein
MSDSVVPHASALSAAGETVVSAMRAALERGDRVGAIECYAAYARACALGAVPQDMEVGALFREALREADAPAPRARPVTPFFGREREVGEVLAALDTGAPAVVLHGPGGVGKTRLASRVAELARERFDAVRWCSVDDVSDDPAPRIEAACDGLSLDARSLIVIDEAELHAARVHATRRLLRVAAPAWTFLITTRFAEAAGDAVLVRVEPFATVAAARFLVERARAAGATLAENAAASPDVARLAERVDGLPVALEVVAAQLRTFSVAEALRRLDAQGPHGLYAERAVAASVEALAANDRRAFVRLGIFPGRWTFEDAQNALAGDATLLSDLPAVLERLVAWSLVHVEHVGTVTAYRYLATTRGVAQRALDDDGLRESLFGTVASATLARAETLGNATLAGSSGFDDLEASLSTIRIALQYGAARDEAVRAFVAMRRFWADRGHSREALALVSAFRVPEDAALAARLALTEAACARRVPDNARASAALGRALELARALGDDEIAGATLTALGAVCFERGDFDASREALEAAANLKSPGSVQWGRALANLAVLHAAGGHDDAALGVYERIEAACDDAHLTLVTAVGRASCYAGKRDAVGARAWIDRAYALLGTNPNAADAVMVAHGETLMATRLGDAPAALAAASAALALSMVNDLTAFTAIVIGLVAIAAAATCDPRTVARIHGFDEAERRRRQLPREPALDVPYRRATASLRSRLGAEAFESGCRAGAAMSVSDIVALVFTLKASEPAEAAVVADSIGVAEIRLASGTVVRDGTVVALAPRERDLVHALLGPERATRERLIDALWPDRAPADAANALRVTLHRLRAKLGPGQTVERMGEAFRLDPSVRVDLIRVERALRRREAGDLDVLAAFVDDVRRSSALPPAERPWSGAIELRLGRATQSAALRLAESYLIAGEPARALDYAAWLCELEPFDEEAIVLAVRAWRAAGDATAARRVRDDYAARLRTELDAEPGAALRALFA